MGLKNPEPTLKFVQKNLHHSNPEVRREMVHGIELRGRTHPKEVIPFLEELQNEENKRVRKTIIHVLGQISYKKAASIK
jgi:HEAT repeat protein